MNNNINNSLKHTNDSNSSSFLKQVLKSTCVIQNNDEKNVFTKDIKKTSRHLDLVCVFSHNSISRKGDFIDNYIELSKNNSIEKTHITMKILEVRNKGKKFLNEKSTHAIKTPIQTIKIEQVK